MFMKMACLDMSNRVSAAPEQVTQNMTEVYGVGAFLMAGIEMLKMK